MVSISSEKLSRDRPKIKKSRLRAPSTSKPNHVIQTDQQCRHTPWEIAPIYPKSTQIHYSSKLSRDRSKSAIAPPSFTIFKQAENQPHKSKSKQIGNMQPHLGYTAATYPKKCQIQKQLSKSELERSRQTLTKQLPKSHLKKCIV